MSGSENDESPALQQSFYQQLARNFSLNCSGLGVCVTQNMQSAIISANEHPKLPIEISAQQQSVEAKQRHRITALRSGIAHYLKPAQIAQKIGVCPRTIYYWIALLRRRGPDEFFKRKQRGGRPAIMSPEVLGQLQIRLQKAEARRAKCIQSWLQEEHKIVMSLSGVYYWLKKLELSE